jgi:hypothetical protein
MVAALVLFLLVSGMQNVRANDTDWEVFSKNLVRALKSDNAGLQQSAMQFVIKYKGQLDVKDAVFEVMRVFRSHQNPKVRQLALVTLTHMNSNWAMEFLRRRIQFEGNEEIKRQLIVINYNSYKTKTEAIKTVTISENDFDSLEKQLLANSD